LIAISIVMQLGFVALVFDMGNIYVARAELQSAADGTAIAAAEELPNFTNVENVALQYAAINGAGQGNILTPGDIQPG
jgi:uncharacterized membrane protein